MTKRTLELDPTDETHMPEAEPGRKYMLYLHVPFCQRLCPYCSFNRYAYREDVARPYFASMRKEMLMLKDLGYDIESIYVGGGTPTVEIDELCETLDLARKASTTPCSSRWTATRNTAAAPRSWSASPRPFRTSNRSTWT